MLYLVLSTLVSMKWFGLIIGVVTPVSSACLSVPRCPTAEADVLNLSLCVLTAENFLKRHPHDVTAERENPRRPGLNNQFLRTGSTVVTVTGKKYLVPVSASAGNNESTDDDAHERDADTQCDPRHRLLVQVVKAFRKGCEVLRQDCYVMNHSSRLKFR